MKKAICRNVSALVILIFLISCVTVEKENPNLIFEDYFEGDSVAFAKPVHWQWWVFAADLWVNEKEDVPSGYGPGVMTLGSKAGNKTLHFGNEVPELQDLTDFEVTLLWTDRLISGEMGDGDFHIGLRTQPVENREVYYPDACYELEIDGDGADASNLIPAEGPTNFHVFIRDGSGIPLESAGKDVFAGPVRNVWYWTKVRITGSRIQSKIWEYDSDEPDWHIDIIDRKNRFTSGGIRLGVWSGFVDIAYIAVEKIDSEESTGPTGGAVDVTTNQTGGEPWQSQLLSIDEESRTLIYTPDESGYSLPDFSYAGYRNSNEPIPEIAETLRINPIEGDNTLHIQNAIEQIAERPLDSSGFRGTLVFNPGEYTIEGTIKVTNSGIILRGSGDGTDPSRDTILKGIGNTPANRTVLVAGSGIETRWEQEKSGSRSNIISDFVPMGTSEFHIENPDLYLVGDNIIIYHPCTEEWLEAVNGGDTGTDPSWRENEQPIVFNRVITAIEGNQISIDVPLYYQLDRKLSQSYIYVADRQYIRSSIGIENLRIQIEATGNSKNSHAMNALDLIGIENSWVKGCTFTGFQLSGVRTATARNITVQNCNAVDPIQEVIPPWMYNFNAFTASQQILFQNNYATNGRHHYVSNGMSWNSGIAFVNNESSGAWAPSEGHRRFSLALLYDNHVELDGPRRDMAPVLLALYNRGDLGTGHGWSAANSVAWNCDTNDGFLVVQKPPTAQNWVIGSSGVISGSGRFVHPSGYIEGANRDGLEPVSLFDAQLEDRQQPE